MIFQRALKRELVQTAAGVFFTLITITITMMFIRILGLAAKGRVAAEDVFVLMAFMTLNYMPIVLVLSSFVAVLLVMTRSYQDSEMVVWFASGLSLTRWIKPVSQFAIPVTFIVAILSFIVTPWAYNQNDEYRERFAKREEISRIAPGKFQESASAQRVLFVEKMSDDLTNVSNVFINSIKNDRVTTIVAQKGSMGGNEDEGEKCVIMENGWRYEEALDESDFRVLEFKKYTAYVTPKNDFTLDSPAIRGTPTWELLQDPTPRKMGELVWRINSPLMGLVLMFLAIPLSFVNPRGGRSLSLIMAVLTYALYSNLSSFIQAFVAQNRLTVWMAWWPLHLIVGSFVVFLFLMRVYVNSPYHPSLWLSQLRHQKAKKENKE